MSLVPEQNNINSNPEVAVLDVRQIPPPERHPLIFGTFDRLAPGTALLLVNDHDPRPLLFQFQSLRPNLFEWNYLEQGPQLWRVRITNVNHAHAHSHPLPTAHAPTSGGCCHLPDHEGRLKSQAFLTSYDEHVAFRPERFNPIVLGQNERTKVILACFEAGQFIPVHKPGVDLTLFILEGTGAVMAGSREDAVTPGSIAFVPGGEARGIRADTRMIALHIVTPPPTEADHAEVAFGLKQGKWK